MNSFQFENSPSPPERYRPQLWEKILTYGCASIVVLVILFVVLYSLLTTKQPDQTSILFLRILLSFALGVFAASLTGYLNVDLSFKGVAIRGTAGFGVLIVTYFFNPPAQLAGHLTLQGVQVNLEERGQLLEKNFTIDVRHADGRQTFIGKEGRATIAIPASITEATFEVSCVGHLQVTHPKRVSIDGKPIKLEMIPDQIPPPFERNALPNPLGEIPDRDTVLSTRGDPGVKILNCENRSAYHLRLLAFNCNSYWQEANLGISKSTHYTDFVFERGKTLTIPFKNQQTWFLLYVKSLKDDKPIFVGDINTSLYPKPILVVESGSMAGLPYQKRLIAGK